MNTFLRKIKPNSNGLDPILTDGRAKIRNVYINLKTIFRNACAVLGRVCVREGDDVHIL